MKNILFIQAEKFGESDYLFFGIDQIRDKNKVKKILLNDILFKKKYDFSLKKSLNPFFETIKRIPSGFLIKGQLNEKDSGGRVMNFICYYIGEEKDFKNYLSTCLNQIGKSYNINSIEEIEKSLISYTLAKKIIIGVLIIATGITLFKTS